MFNFFFSPPAHLCAITYITEISLHVTLSYQSHSLTPNFEITVWTRITDEERGRECMKEGTEG